MAFVVSVIVFTVGAIARYAVVGDGEIALDVDMVGAILMIVGAIGCAFSSIYWRYRR